MATSRLMMTTEHLVASGTPDINATAGIAEVYSDGTDLTAYAGMMIKATDGAGLTCWGILTDQQGPTGADWVEVCSTVNGQDMTFNQVDEGFTEGTLASLKVMITDRPYREMEGTPVKESIRTPFDGGYSQSRPRSTRGREKFSLEWRFQSIADYVAFQATFNALAGSMFFMSHPLTHRVLLAMFSEESYRWKPLSATVISVTVMFEEV